MNEITVYEAAERKKMHPEAVRRNCRNRKLTTRRVGRNLMIALDEKYWAMRAGEDHQCYLDWLRERSKEGSEAVNIIRAIELLEAVVKYDVEAIKEMDIRVGLDRLRDYIKCQLHVAIGVQSSEAGK